MVLFEDVYKKLADSYYFNSDLKNANKWYQKLYDLKMENWIKTICLGMLCL